MGSFYRHDLTSGLYRRHCADALDRHDQHDVVALPNSVLAPLVRPIHAIRSAS